MKVLIWIGCFFVTALIQALFGMKLGGIPAAMFFGATFSIAQNFASRYDSRKNKTSKKYADSTKGLMKGFAWYGASILYVILGTISVSSDPMSFDFGTQSVIAILCIGFAMIGHLIIDKKVNIPYSEELETIASKNNPPRYKCEMCDHLCEKVTYSKLIGDMGIRYRNLCDACIEIYNAVPEVKQTAEAPYSETTKATARIHFCRKCGTNLEEDSRFCRKCGTEIKEEQQ